MSMPTMGRLLGLDVGEARTGIAASDGLQMLASPLQTLAVKSPEADVAALAEVVRTQEAVGIVVGLPLNQHGELGPQAEKVLAFVELLRAQVSVPIETVDERFSTVAAQRTLTAGGVKGKKARAAIDQLAAANILQTWLDRRAAARRRGEE